MSDDSVLWLLGDQLNPDLDALANADEVLLIEAHGFADRKPYHTHKLTLVFSAMRHARDALRERGHDVTYLRAESFGDGLDTFFDEEFAGEPGDADLRLMRPASHGAGDDRLREVVAERGGALELLDNELFWTTPDDWREWTGESTGESDGEETEPDRRRGRERRQTLPTGELVPPRPPRDGRADGRRRAGRRRAELRRPQSGDAAGRLGTTRAAAVRPDELTRETHAWVRERFDTWGTDSLDEFAWPVTREEAQTALDAFVRDRLPSFGRYEDAMVTDEPFLSHSLLSPAINPRTARPARAGPGSGGGIHRARRRTGRVRSRRGPRRQRFWDDAGRVR